MLLPLTALAVCLAAAGRSTWSPCGLSMLSTITPMTERAGGRRYEVTVRWFVLGALAGGLCLGAVMAGLAGAVAATGPTARTTVALALGACLLAAASDLGIRGLRLPVHRRQVNERWLDEFRPWVYGTGFGWQLGTGLATYITTCGVYLLVVLGALTGRPVTALALGAVFGIVRGLAILVGRAVTGPGAMRALHRRLSRLEPASRRVVIGTELAAAVSCALVLPGRSAGVGVAFAVCVVAVVVLAVVAVAWAAALARSAPTGEG